MQKNLKLLNERLCQKIQEFHDRRQADLTRCVARLHTELQSIDKFIGDSKHLLLDVNVQVTMDLCRWNGRTSVPSDGSLVAIETAISRTSKTSADPLWDSLSSIDLRWSSPSLLARDLIDSTPTIQFVSSSFQILNEELAGSLVLDKPNSTHIHSTGDHDSRLSALASGRRSSASWSPVFVDCLTRHSNG